jgi:hypothetical protein
MGFSAPFFFTGLRQASLIKIPQLWKPTETPIYAALPEAGSPSLSLHSSEPAHLAILRICQR